MSYIVNQLNFTVQKNRKTNKKQYYNQKSNVKIIKTWKIVKIEYYKQKVM